MPATSTALAANAGPAAPPTLEALARQVQALPPLPDALQAVLEAIGQAQGSLHRCISLIERDQALTAAVLRLANSAFYGLPGQVHRVDAALRLLGLRPVAAVLSAGALRQSLRTDGCAGFDFADYWRHALLSAGVSRALAGRTGVEPDAAFLAGMMHGVGQLVLAALAPEALAAALTQARGGTTTLETAEQAVLGFDHRALGALLLARWHFPADVVQAVGAPDLAEPPADGGATASGRLAFVLQTASLVARRLQADAAAFEPPERQPDLVERIRQLGLAAESLPALLAGLRDAADAMAGG